MFSAEQIGGSRIISKLKTLAEAAETLLPVHKAA
jgi:hypothetical protein